MAVRRLLEERDAARRVVLSLAERVYRQSELLSKRAERETPKPMTPTVYTASRVRHADKWLAMRSAGVRVIATWIDEARAGQTSSMADLWSRCIREAGTADRTLLYVEDGDLPLKGALLEVGAALAAGRPVYITGSALVDLGDMIPGHSWTNHPLVRRVASIDEFTAEVLRPC